MITVLMGAPAAGKTTWMLNNKTGFEHIYSTELVRVDREIDVDYYMASIRHKAISAAKNGSRSHFNADRYSNLVSNSNTVLLAISCNSGGN